LELSSSQNQNAEITTNLGIMEIDDSPDAGSAKQIEKQSMDKMKDKILLKFKETLKQAQSQEKSKIKIKGKKEKGKEEKTEEEKVKKVKVKKPKFHVPKK
jgi:hypothetical protein